MKWFYSLLIASASAFGMAIIFGWSGIFIQSPPDSNTFITLSGFLLATAGWLFSGSVSVRLKLREQSLKYLNTMSERMGASGNLNKLWNDYGIDQVILSEQLKDQFFVQHALDHPLFVAMRDIANSYEDIAIAIKEGAVEEKMMRRSFATNLKWFWPRLQPFLQLYRNDPPRAGHPHGVLPNPKVFSHCKALAAKWDGKEI